MEVSYPGVGRKRGGRAEKALGGRAKKKRKTNRRGPSLEILSPCLRKKFSGGEVQLPPLTKRGKNSKKTFTPFSGGGSFNIREKMQHKNWTALMTWGKKKGAREKKVNDVPTRSCRKVW